MPASKDSRNVIVDEWNRFLVNRFVNHRFGFHVSSESIAGKQGSVERDAPHGRFAAAQRHTAVISCPLQHRFSPAAKPAPCSLPVAGRDSGAGEGSRRRIGAVTRTAPGRRWYIGGGPARASVLTEVLEQLTLIGIGSDTGTIILLGIASDAGTIYLVGHWKSCYRNNSYCPGREGERLRDCLDQGIGGAVAE